MIFTYIYQKKHVHNIITDIVHKVFNAFVDGENRHCDANGLISTSCFTSTAETRPFISLLHHQKHLDVHGSVDRR